MSNNRDHFFLHLSLNFYPQELGEENKETMN